MSTPDELGSHKEVLKPEHAPTAEARRIIEEYAHDLRQIIRMLRRISTERTALDGRSTTGGLIGRMGQHQYEIDDLTRMERLCRDMAEESALPLEGAALLEKARRYSAAGRRAQQLCT